MNAEIRAVWIMRLVVEVYNYAFRELKVCLPRNLSTVVHICTSWINVCHDCTPCWSRKSFQPDHHLGLISPLSEYWKFFSRKERFVCKVLSPGPWQCMSVRPGVTSCLSSQFYLLGLLLSGYKYSFSSFRKWNSEQFKKFRLWHSMILQDGIMTNWNYWMTDRKMTAEWLLSPTTSCFMARIDI